MMLNFRSFVVLVTFVGCFTAVTRSSAHSPVDFLEVVRVKPAQMIEHGVEVQSRFDSKRRNVSLEGPVLFSRAVGAMKREVKSPRAYMNWFAIKNPQQQKQRQVDVLDMVRGAANKRLTVGNESYLVSPSQLLAQGTPDEVPDGLDIYKAYEIIDAAPLKQKLEIESSIGKGSVMVGKPIYLCTPAVEWHHDETFAVTHPNDCFVVYQVEEQPTTVTFNTIDQFGLNELKGTSIQLVCVRAAFLRDKTD